MVTGRKHPWSIPHFQISLRLLIAPCSFGRQHRPCLHLLEAERNAIGHPLSLDPRSFQVLWRIYLLLEVQAILLFPRHEMFSLCSLETLSMFCSVDCSGDTRNLVPNTFPNDHQVLPVLSSAVWLCPFLATVTWRSPIEITQCSGCQNKSMEHSMRYNPYQDPSLAPRSGCAGFIFIFVNLTQAGVSWEEGTGHCKDCLHQIIRKQDYETLSWLVADIERPSHHGLCQPCTSGHDVYKKVDWVCLGASQWEAPLHGLCFQVPTSSFFPDFFVRDQLWHRYHLPG